MSYVTILWTTVAASGLVLAVIHGFVWALDRRAYANLAFAFISLTGIAMAWNELGTMHAQTPAEWGMWVRWFQVPNFCYIAGTMVFVRLYLGTGRPWLMWTIIVVRFGILLVNFMVEPNFNFKSIDSIERISFLGDQVTVVGHAAAAPRQIVATLATLLSLAFFIDATVSYWRRHPRGDRRQGVIVGGGIVFFFAFAVINSQLIIWGVFRLPTLISPPFLVTLAAMAFEMSRETLRASRLARDLRESEGELQLAAAAAGLGLWSWEAESDRIQATDRARAMFGISKTDPLKREQILAAIHNDDLPRIREAIKAAMTSTGEQDVRFRVINGNEVRWIVGRGHSGFDSQGKLTLMQGVLRDVTELHRSQEEMEELRNALSHAGRVTILGQLSLAIAHELRQPLGAILFNVEAAQAILEKASPDLQELKNILVDIGRDNRRAGEVMDRMRGMLKLRPMNFQPVAIDGIVRDVVSLIRQDAMRRGVTLDMIFDADVDPAITVSGDRVHLSQVLINLVMNALDAMSKTSAGERKIVIRVRVARPDALELAVIDNGIGIENEAIEKIFEPFYTTKTTGMGMGLSISRTIIQAHRGRLWAENNAGGGATFHLELPTSQGDAA